MFTDANTVNHLHAEFDAARWPMPRILLVAVGLAAWFGVSALLGVTGYLSAGSDVALRPILLSIAVPVAAFLGLYARSARFRSFILPLVSPVGSPRISEPPSCYRIFPVSRAS